MLLLSVLAITTRSLLRAATYLLLVLICTAGLYLFLNYQFLAAAQISVYAGGVLILFIFAIFLTTPGKQLLPKRKQFKKYIYATLVFVSGFAMAAYVILKQNLYPAAETVVGASLSNTESMSVIAGIMTGTGKYQYLLPFEVLSILLFVCIIGGILIARKRK
jgi:NADH-quinone oxidoreductase subunit J